MAANDRFYTNNLFQLYLKDDNNEKQQLMASQNDYTVYNY
uniref:Bm1221, isoform b n=1 Tax=Brugia malayi TaxID=6279 RepID=A0A1I9G0Y3_BRUMA|nr:Bm1221, isoform b [Brugia malayi]